MGINWEHMTHETKIIPRFHRARSKQLQKYKKYKTNIFTY